MGYNTAGKCGYYKEPWFTIYRKMKQNLQKVYTFLEKYDIISMDIFLKFYKNHKYIIKNKYLFIF